MKNILILSSKICRLSYTYCERNYSTTHACIMWVIPFLLPKYFEMESFTSHYLPQLLLQEDNVFTGVGNTTSPWTWDLGYPSPSLRHRTWDSPLLLPSGGHNWRPVQTCSIQDMCIPHWYWHLMVAAETHTVVKQVYSSYLFLIMVLLRRHFLLKSPSWSFCTIMQ